MTVSLTLKPRFTRECRIDGRPVRLPEKEGALLETLLLSPPERTVGRSELIEAVWPDPDTQALTAPKALHVYVRRLRRRGIRIESIGNCKGFVGYRIPAQERTA